MTTLYIMKCNKKPYHKVGVANNVDHRRYDIETSIQQEYGNDHGSEWFMVKGGLPKIKKYLALGFKYFKSNPAPMPKSWERKRDGSIYKRPDFVKGKPHSTQGKSHS
jgi:hypothetical protein